MKFCIVTNWRMGNTKVTIIFQNSYATPLSRLLLRVIRSRVTTYQIYMKFCIVTNWRMANTKMAFKFQIYNATPIIRLSIGIINDLKVTCNYLSELIEIFYGDQLDDDGKYNDGFYLSNFLCFPYN